MATFDNVVHLDTVPAIGLPAARKPGRPTRLRLRLRHPSVRDGFVDGAWWPRSANLSIELPPLLAVMYAAGYDVRRVTYHVAAWEQAPRRMRVSGHLVQLAGYHTQDTASISLVDRSGQNRLELLVVPPSTKTTLARRCLILSAFISDLRASEILERVNSADTTARTEQPLAS